MRVGVGGLLHFYNRNMTKKEHFHRHDADLSVPDVQKKIEVSECSDTGRGSKDSASTTCLPKARHGLASDVNFCTSTLRGRFTLAPKTKQG